MSAVQYISNVLLKVNAKLGGTNSAVRSPLSESEREETRVIAQIDDNYTKWVSAKPCMVVCPPASGLMTWPPSSVAQFGIDSTHPSPGPGAHNRCVGVSTLKSCTLTYAHRPTISALVGSMDRLASSYQATVRVQEGRVEIINDLEVCSRS
jgi:hypothetical protein